MRFGIAAVIMMIATQTQSHDWYPRECCREHDCISIAKERVQRLPSGGYVIDGRFTIGPRSVRSSPDGQYHGCFPRPDFMVCFFAPPESF